MSEKSPSSNPSPSSSASTTPPQHAKESLLHEAVEGVLDIAAWATIRSVVWKILKQLWKLLTEGALGGAKEATQEIIAGRIKKPFKEIRAEVYGYIDTKVRAAEGDVVEEFFAHLKRRRLGLERPYGDHAKYGPLEEYKGWAVLMGFYSSLEDPGTEEQQRLEVFRRVVRSGPEAFDNFVEDLTHDVIRQAWLWIVETTAPLWQKIRSLWLLGDNRLKAAMVLFVGLPIWLILGELFLGSMHQTWSWIILGAAAICGAVWGILMFLDHRRRRRDNEDPNSPTFWRSAFGWGSLGLLPIIFLIGVLQDTSLFRLSYLIPWIMGITFAVGIFWLIFGNQPLFALILHYFGEWPKYGRPVRRVLKDFGAAILFNLLFAIFLPLAHLHEHSLRAILLILVVTAFFWAVYAERRIPEAILGSIIVLIFAFGFMTSGAEIHRTLTVADTAAGSFFKEFDEDKFARGHKNLSRIFIQHSQTKTAVVRSAPVVIPPSVPAAPPVIFKKIVVAVPPEKWTCYTGPDVPFNSIQLTYQSGLQKELKKKVQYIDGTFDPAVMDLDAPVQVQAKRFSFYNPTPETKYVIIEYL